MTGGVRHHVKAEDQRRLLMKKDPSDHVRRRDFHLQTKIICVLDEREDGTEGELEDHLPQLSYSSSSKKNITQ